MACPCCVTKMFPGEMQHTYLFTPQREPKRETNYGCHQSQTWWTNRFYWGYLQEYSEGAEMTQRQLYHQSPLQHAWQLGVTRHSKHTEQCAGSSMDWGVTQLYLTCSRQVTWSVSSTEFSWSLLFPGSLADLFLTDGSTAMVVWISYPFKFSGK